MEMDIQTLHKKVEDELKQVDNQLTLLESDLYIGSMAIRGGWEFYYVLGLSREMGSVKILKTIVNLINMLESVVSTDIELLPDESDRIIVVQVTNRYKSVPEVRIHIPELK